jgi:mercuric ion transport protein
MTVQSIPTEERRAGDESRDRGVPWRDCRDGGRCAAPGTSPPGAELKPREGRNRGLLWIAGGFLFCPCHLPLTLALLGVALGGTLFGAALEDHPIAAGTVITVGWALATWRGFWLLHAASRRG